MSAAAEDPVGGYVRPESDREARGYAAVVGAAAKIATCPHLVGSREQERATRFLDAEFRRWAEDDAEDAE